MVPRGPNPPSSITARARGHRPGPLARATAPSSEALLARAERLAPRRNLIISPRSRPKRDRRLRLAISAYSCGRILPSNASARPRGEFHNLLAREPDLLSTRADTACRLYERLLECHTYTLYPCHMCVHGNWAYVYRCTADDLSSFVP